ncbi:uncharacterized protein At2g39795, mitochondrial-like [Nicotiana sylvestris]|uniref:Uncharacterized protein At2g39795, mitochondrial-like n=1 Tax=Nicotiana sylvestris TaxID=4096 RepID=A0A1U7W0J4_NICSY|nr:PREDICTED: uncharacterized protein At2g39795, mitochondrial-like [Nicotiana sylvestris]XP_009773543.1 PREDICTED: uncharacterized protein At2g39795, mitochondrial-like [Nicotiana sylvestris]
MALYSAIRRASNSTIPLAVRSVATSATSHFSAATTAVENSDCGRVSRSFSIPVLHYSTSAVKKKKSKHSSFDDILLQIVNSEINFSLDSDFHDCVVDIPDGFPFKVQDKAGERVIVLTRDYGEEAISIEIDMPNGRCENAEDDAVDSEEESESQPSVPLSVTVSKENGLALEFDVRAFPNKILICGISIKELKSSSNQLDYRGPAFSLLNESLQKSFYEYLEVRGLTGSTANFLLEYVISKDSKEYIRWLKTIKKFVEN